MTAYKGEVQIPELTAKAHSAARRTLFVVVMVMMVAFIDRQLLNLLIDPIRSNFKISDIQFSLLQGPAFTLVYIFVMLPVSGVSDRSSRKYVLLISILAWSTMTVVFGLSTTFFVLLMARAGVAIGEAAAGPASMSMIRDVYPKHRQAAALSLVSIGGYLGGAVSLGGGGAALDWLNRAQRAGELLVGLSPWRILFLIAGALGLIAALLLSIIREPSRPPKTAESVSWSEYGRLLRIEWKRAVAFLCVLSGVGAVTTATLAWMPAILMRIHHWTPGMAGLSLSVAHFLFAASGALGGGCLADRMLERNYKGRFAYVLLFGVIAMAVGGVVAAKVGDGRLAVAFNALSNLGIGACLSTGSIGFQAMFPSRFSGRAVATYLMVSGVLGTAIGPTIVPMTAKLLGAPRAIDMGLAICTAVAMGWSLGWLLWLISLERGRSTES